MTFIVGELPAELADLSRPTSAMIDGDVIAYSSLRGMAEEGCDCAGAGVIRVGRPAPKPATGIVEVDEICACVIRAHMAARARLQAPIVADAALVESVKREMQPPPAWLVKKITRLQVAIDKERDRAEALLLAQGQRIAPLADNAAAASAAVANDMEKVTYLQDQAAAARLEISDLEQQLVTAREKLSRLTEELAGMRDGLAGAMNARTAADAAIDRERAKDERELASIRARIEKLDGRLRIQKARYPTAA